MQAQENLIKLQSGLGHLVGLPTKKRSAYSTDCRPTLVTATWKWKSYISYMQGCQPCPTKNREILRYENREK